MFRCRCRSLPVLAALPLLALGACSGEDAATERGECPIEPVAVVVTVDQWGDIVEQLGGDCADVTTIVDGSAADPHDYEPSPSDTASFDDADLVVRNGLGYDAWSERALDTLDERPPVVDAGEVLGLEDGDNPHVWYGPEEVREVAAAISDGLAEAAPSAAAYLDERAAAWDVALRPYDDELAAVRTLTPGATYLATEPVFDLMAAAAGLRDATPSGYRRAALNETEPSPADLAAFEAALDGGASVLVYNAQTEGPTPQRLREIAEDGGVPVVEVTETVPADAGGFVDWQVGQLQALRRALGG